MLRYVFVLSLCLVWSYQSFEHEHPAECKSCNPEDCYQVADCVAGLTKDPCGCCDVCAKSEFELCDHPKVPPSKSGLSYGRCGENLECKLRTDLTPGKVPEAICYCVEQDQICASDNKTYDNICRMRAAAVVLKENIEVVKRSPCDADPVIVSPPENVKNLTGSNIALLCEAKGVPIPVIEWMWTRVDGTRFNLPSDDLHIAINMRGGPEKWQVTGWLQIIDLKKEHEGDYTCVAHSSEGRYAEATARVNVI